MPVLAFDTSGATALPLYYALHRACLISLLSVRSCLSAAQPGEKTLSAEKGSAPCLKYQIFA